MFNDSDFIESLWQKMDYVFYNFKEDKIVVCEFQRWVDEGNKIMVNIHNKERCMREDIFLKSHEYIGTMDYNQNKKQGE